MFSPITERSLKIRLLYTTIYLLLILGGVTMIVPFMIMISGSVEPRSQVRTASLLPTYFVDDQDLWIRYLEARYQGVPDNLRSSWSDPSADFIRNPLPESSDEGIKLWQEFLKETQPDARLFTMAFLRTTLRMPSYAGNLFRYWLMPQYDNDLSKMNAALGTQIFKLTSVAPPVIGLVGPTLANTPLVQKYYEFLGLQPESLKLAWDVGGYYRSVFLPRIHGVNIQAYNAKYGTNYQSYSEVPFTATVPEIGRDDWFLFVGKILRPDFVQLTPEGQVALQASQVLKDEFVRVQAKPEHLKVVSLDVLFQEWAAERGVANARIPQKNLDRMFFEQEKNFWRWEFATINYKRVLDEILLHGRAISNTVILVVLMVCGALIINPLAAYALSRFKLRQTYTILVFFLATIAFPAEVTMIPVFLQLKEFNLLNTFGALVLPGLANGFSIFLLKGFFDSLPKELFEAAELDGASEWTMFWQITMNLSKPILAVIALGAFTTAYGAFFYALILAPDPKMWTIMVYIYQLRMGVDSPVVYASLIITAIPTLLVFIFCQNIILRGIVVPSDK